MVPVCRLLLLLLLLEVLPLILWLLRLLPEVLLVRWRDIRRRLLGRQILWCLALRDLVGPVLLRSNTGARSVVDHTQHVLIGRALACTWAAAAESTHILLWLHPSSELVGNPRAEDMVTSTVIAIVMRFRKMLVETRTTTVVERP